MRLAPVPRGKCWQDDNVNDVEHHGSVCPKAHAGLWKVAMVANLTGDLKYPIAAPVMAVQGKCHAEAMLYRNPGRKQCVSHVGDDAVEVDRDGPS